MDAEKVIPINYFIFNVLIAWIFTINCILIPFVVTFVTVLVFFCLFFHSFRFLLFLSPLIIITL